MIWRPARRRDTTADSGRRLRVLQSFPPRRRETNPYVTQLYESLQAHLDVRYFSWREALTGRYDVFHVHWPDITMRGSTPARTIARRALFLGLLLRIRLTRRALVRTQHNVAPHETGGRTERAVLKLCDRWTTLWISLSEPTSSPTGAATVTIRHGHYRDWYGGHPTGQAIPRRLLYFGLIRPYKGVAELIDVVRTHPDSRVRLRLVGSPAGNGVAAAVLAACKADDRISAILDYVDESVLAREIGQAAMVVLPYRDMHNSGSALLALSLARPILVPANSVTRALAEEMGHGWVHTYENPLTVEAIDAALDQAMSTAGDAPDLSLREWDGIALSHVAAYRTALRHVRGLGCHIAEPMTLAPAASIRAGQMGSTE